MKKAELLSPAGDFTKMKFAIHYGADAVYGGIKNFSLREGATNFDFEELKNAVEYAHNKGKKFYLTLNIFFHEKDLHEFKSIVKDIIDTEVDALIVSDIGIVHYLREKYPEVPLHISTQANSLNSETVAFYEKLGIKRVVLARELTLEEIRIIREKSSIELETFVHGAMCIAYSGRCLLSNYFTNPSLYRPGKKPSAIKNEKARDANRGDCAQACRWEYYIVESTRREDALPIIVEDNLSTTILSSKDLNLAPFLDLLMDAGIDSFKIEGRMKSSYYVANVTRVYRKCIDNIVNGLPLDLNFIEELNYVSHREYTTGFYFEENKMAAHTTDKGYIRNYIFLGYIVEEIEEGKYLCKASNQINNPEELEIISPQDNIMLRKFYFTDLKCEKKLTLIQPNEEFLLLSEGKLEPLMILRVKAKT